MSFIKYKHHGHEVSVREDLKGLHREHCLCYRCERFGHCPIANEVYAVCLKHHVALPVWECPEFEEYDDPTI
jgi:hypothetical protein